MIVLRQPLPQTSLGFVANGNVLALSRRLENDFIGRHLYDRPAIQFLALGDPQRFAGILPARNWMAGRSDRSLAGPAVQAAISRAAVHALIRENKCDAKMPSLSLLLEAGEAYARDSPDATK